MCSLFKVSTSGYYAWLKCEPSEREQADQVLLAKIKQIHTDSMQTYGAPRIHAELRAQGTRVGRKRVARLMRESGLCGVSRRRSVKTTTRSEQDQQRPDLMERDFSGDAPDRLWVADITYVPTTSGFLYLAVVLDAFSRRSVGWTMAHHLRTELVLAALNMAVEQHKPKSVIHHSDRGSQYTSLAFGYRCREAGARPSTGSVGDCYNNAMCESFFATLECELIDRRRFTTKSEARMAIFQFIKGWYNMRRRHSGLDYAAPLDYENQYHQSITDSSQQLSAEAG